MVVHFEKVEDCYMVLRYRQMVNLDDDVRYHYLTMNYFDGDGI
jgi:hypothetical protein